VSFGRLERPRADTPFADINVTPLVDVMLVLLVIFIVAAPLMATRLALDLPRAQAAQATHTPATVLTLALDVQGRRELDGAALDDSALDAALRHAAEADPATELQLRVDARVPYGEVAGLIGRAQAAGLSRIGFVAEPAAPAR